MPTLDRPQREVQESSSRLSRLKLVNIGPFPSLDLGVETDWTVFLGNNGCGKSTILRAAALGLCGDEPLAETSAQRLLRSDSNEGLIEIVFDGRLFQTELYRDGTKVRIRSRTLTPLQTGRAVILGFPALRGVSQKRIKGPTHPGPQSPEITDLLPLLTGEVDYRLQSTIQWIVNTHLQLDTYSKEVPSFTRLRDTFFEFLRRLTPGLSFTFSHVDRESWQVFLHTEDGNIPIESLSQGTSSIFSWVGTLVQRLFEIFHRSSEPEKEPAIVLIDEIDAHMHPHWQQTIAPLLRESFPNLQVLATTHSPLIVGSLMPLEVFHITRSARAGSITVARLQDSFQGWRADQILTGPAFDLKTTISKPADILLSQYAELNAKSERDWSEEERLRELSKNIQRLVPSHPETVEGRIALNLIEGFFRERLRIFSREQREAILNEGNKILEEMKGDKSQL